MSPAQLIERFDRIAEAPDAVPRLRRFILDLAVRGKLVEQDPSDEPALELLKRTQTGKKTKEISVSAVASDELLFPLPSGWSGTRFGEVYSLEYGDNLPADKRSNTGEYPVYGSNGVVGTHNECFVDAPCIVVGRKGSAGAINLSLADGCCVTDVAYYCIPPQGLDLAFSFKLFHTLGLDTLGKGIKPGLSRKEAYQLPIAIPPLAEQHRIVAKVEELMALCDRLEAAQREREQRRDRLVAASLRQLQDKESLTQRHEGTKEEKEANEKNLCAFAPSREPVFLRDIPRLTTRHEHIKALRQTILNLAVCGRLVPQDPNDESATKLLERLKASKIAAYASENLRARPPIAPPARQRARFNFPWSWELASFDDVFVIVSGVTKGQKIPWNEAIQVPYLRVANVQRGWLDLKVIKTLAVRLEDKERYNLKKNDILMTEGGDWDKLGRAAIWRNEIAECIHQNHIFRVRPPSQEILSEWVTGYVNSPLGRGYFEDASKQTTNLASINLTQLRACPLPIPPLAEQHRIGKRSDPPPPR